MTPLERMERRCRALGQIRERVAQEASADVPAGARFMVWNRCARITGKMLREREKAARTPARSLMDLKAKARVALDTVCDDPESLESALISSICRDVLAMKVGK